MARGTSLRTALALVVHSPTVPNVPLRLTVSTRSGSVRVEGHSEGGLIVEGGTVHEQPDGSIRIDPLSASVSLRLRCPAGSDVSVGTASGKVVLSGELGAVRIATMSGSVEVGHVISADVRSASAGIDIDRCDDECRIVSMSGGVRVRHAGRAEIATKSGHISVTATETADLRSVNGSVKVWVSDKVALRARTMSSAVIVHVPRGARPKSHLSSFSGSIQNRTTDGDDGSIEVRTESGSIRVIEQ